jgi:hypothetical protein
MLIRVHLSNSILLLLMKRELRSLAVAFRLFAALFAVLLPKERRALGFELSHLFVTTHVVTMHMYM